MIILQMSYEMGRIASAEQLSQAIRRYIVSIVDWIDALCSLAHITDPSEKARILA